MIDDVVLLDVLEYKDIGAMNWYQRLCTCFVSFRNQDFEIWYKTSAGLGSERLFVDYSSLRTVSPLVS